MYDNVAEKIKAAQNGDNEAMTLLIKENNGLIWSIVKRFCDRGYEKEELYQIGSIGFIKAVKRFDANFEVRLSTYAVPYMIGEIKRFIRDDGPIKVSRSLKELSSKIRSLQKQFLDETGEEITIYKMAELLHTDKEEIVAALEYTRPIESINSEIYSEGGASKIEKISIGTDEMAQTVDRIVLKQLIESLELREKEIVVLRYFKNKTQSEIAKMLGITQVQVSRIEKKVLANMKRKLVY